MSAAAWQCFLCSKRNDAAAAICACCGRSKAVGPHSIIDHELAAPLALHGLAVVDHTFCSEQLAALQQHGLDLAASAQDGWGALHVAAQLGQAETIARLLRVAHADARAAMVEMTTRGGYRALHYAIANGHLAAVEELLLADADVNARLSREDDGWTPLHLAAQSGHALIVALLLQSGADAHLRTAQLAQTALHLAVQHRQSECVRILASETDLVLLEDAHGMSPLQLAHLLPMQDPSAAAIRALLDAAYRERRAGRGAPLLDAFLVSATSASMS